MTSAEFVRQFGHLWQTATHAPIIVTHHGRATNVLLTAKHYADMIAERDSYLESRGSADPVPSLQEFAGWIQQGVVILNQIKEIIFANAVAYAMLDRAAGSLLGKKLYHAVPELEGSLAQTYINRAAVSKETGAADLPSVIRRDNWIRLEVFPTARSTTILFRDITEDVVQHRLADAKKAIVEAMSVHGGIGYMRVSARGQIERVDEPLCRMLDLPEDRLLRVQVADIVPPPSRAAFRDKLETVLLGQGAQLVETTFLSSSGNDINVCGAITELRGIYGNEGAVIVVTRC